MAARTYSYLYETAHGTLTIVAHRPPLEVRLGDGVVAVVDNRQARRQAIGVLIGVEDIARIVAGTQQICDGEAIATAAGLAWPKFRRAVMAAMRAAALAGVVRVVSWRPLLVAAP